MHRTLWAYLSACAAVFAPVAVFAHEVYVLDEATVREALSIPSVSPFTAYRGNEYEFYFWGLISFVALSTVVCASIFRSLENRFDPFFFRIKRYALLLVRLTVGASLISFGWYGALFGPELALTELFGDGAFVARAALVLLGVGVLLGIAVRIIALILIGLFAYAYIVFDWYAFTYADHLGSFLALLILGGGPWSLSERLDLPHLLPGVRTALHRYAHLAFPLLRVLFGFGIMFAAVYAKFLHSELAYQVVVQYDLTRYFPFEPMFVVLGAFLIEFLAGFMLFLGIAVRWTGLFLLFWLTLSLLYFQEAVWPHIVLFGLALALFCHGYDRYSLGGLLFKRGGREPIL